MDVHVLLEEQSIPIRMEATLTIEQTDTGYSASTMWDQTRGKGTTPESALLDYLQKELESLHLFSKYFKTDERREYVDQSTDVLLVVEKDNPGYPGHPKLTFVCPEHTNLSVEAINGAMRRLQIMAGIPPHQRIEY